MCTPALAAHPRLLLRQQHDELEIGTACQREHDLLVAEPAVTRMVETALTADALDHFMLAPASCEKRTTFP